MASPRDQLSNTPVLICRICHKPVPIGVAKTDSDGKAVHGDCFFLEINSSMRDESKKVPGPLLPRNSARNETPRR